MANPNDLIRDAILRELREVYVSARSVRATAIGIKDLQRRLREKHGYKQQEVAANLTYLIQKGLGRRSRRESNLYDRQGDADSVAEDRISNLRYRHRPSRKSIYLRTGRRKGTVNQRHE